MSTERVSIIIVMWQNLFSHHHGESKEEKKEMGGGFDGDQKGFNCHS